MSASPDESSQQTCVRIAYRYLLAAILCAGFGAAYEFFSHDVYAYGMMYGYGWPLLGGVSPALFLAKRGGKLPSDTARLLWHFGISALTVGSLFSGALEIYGTSSRLTAVYWLSGGACLILSLFTAVFSAKTREKTVVSP